MTLEEEILKLDLIASDAFEGGDANEFRQLAEWLKELKMLREVIDNKSFEITDPLDPHRHHVLVVKVTDLYNDFFDF